MNFSSRFYLYAPLAFLLLVAAGAGIHWWIVAGALGRSFDALARGEAMPGVTIRYTARSIAGFPFRLDAVFSGFQVEIATDHGPIVWRAEKFALHRLTYGRDDTIFEAAGRQELDWTDGDGGEHRLPFAAGSAHASAIRNSGGLSRFDLDLVDLGSPLLTAARFQLHARRGADRIDIASTAQDVRLSPRLRSAFGGVIRAIALDGGLTEPQALDGLRAGRTDWRTALEAWREEPGRLRIDRLDIDWGGLRMQGRGGLSLDDARRPLGILDFKIAGMAGWLARNPVMLPDGIAAALRERAAKAGSDEAGRMGAIYGIKDSVVYLGEVPVGTAEPLY